MSLDILLMSAVNNPLVSVSRILSACVFKHLTPRWWAHQHLIFHLALDRLDAQASHPHPHSTTYLELPPLMPCALNLLMLNCLIAPGFAQNRVLLPVIVQKKCTTCSLNSFVHHGRISIPLFYFVRATGHKCDHALSLPAAIFDV